MSERAGASSPATRLAASEAWQTVGDGLLSGLCHELNDRIAALAGVLHVATGGGELDDTLGQLLAEEIARLERLAELLRLLPSGRRDEPEPIRIPELLPPVLELQRLQPGLEYVDIEVTGDAASPPVLIDWSSLSKGLLILLGAAARQARAAGHACVRLTYGAEGEFVVIGMGAAPAEGRNSPGQEDLPPPAEGAMAAVQEAMAAAGGELRLLGPAESRRYELRLPGLPFARERGL
ncbi:MAG: hypothetical protein HY703_10755 [Gemmatimonadetes bacterium]|nr:hypothetical protein [Gemmatimonadota bacterium]